MEGIEDVELQTQEHKQKSNKTKKSSDDSKKEGKSPKEQKYCELHGECAHTTKECRTLQKQKKHKSYDKNDSDKPKCQSKNISWSRKAEEAKLLTNKEVNAFIKKAVKKGVAKEVAAFECKRKAGSDSDASSSEEEGELHMLDLSSELKGFNYQDMDKLCIDNKKSEDESIDDDFNIDDISV